MVAISFNSVLIIAAIAVVLPVVEGIGFGFLAGALVAGGLLSAALFPGLAGRLLRGPASG
jgi:hypothetical protein